MPSSLPEIRSKPVGGPLYGRGIRGGDGTGCAVRWARRAVGETVRGLPPAYWWLWGGTLVNRAGAFVIVFLAFYLTDGLGYSAAFAGVALAAFGLGGTVATVVGGVLADRLGRRPLLLGANVAAAVSLVGLGLVESRPALVAWAAAYGFCGGLPRPAYAAMMADIVPPASLVRAFALQYWAINLGFAVAPVLAGLLAQSGYLTLFLVDASTTLVFAAVVFWRLPESHPGLQGDAATRAAADAPAGSLTDVLRDRVFMTFAALVFGWALVFMQHASTLPVAMGDDGLSSQQYGSVIALNGVLIVLVTVPLSRWLQRFPISNVLALSCALTGVGYAATAWAHVPTAYAMTVVVWTVGEVVGAAVGPVLVAELSPAAMRGRYQGMFGLAFGVAAFAAPLAGGLVYDGLGGTALWLACGVIGLATAVGHLLVAPAREARVREIRAGAEVPVGTDAVPVPVPRTLEEAEAATTPPSPS